MPGNLITALRPEDKMSSFKDGFKIVLGLNGYGSDIDKFVLHLNKLIDSRREGAAPQGGYPPNFPEFNKDIATRWLRSGIVYDSDRKYWQIIADLLQIDGEDRSYFTQLILPENTFLGKIAKVRGKYIKFAGNLKEPENGYLADFFEEILSHSDIEAPAFAVELGLNPEEFAEILSGETFPDKETLQQIVTIFNLNEDQGFRQAITELLRGDQRRLGISQPRAKRANIVRAGQEAAATAVADQLGDIMVTWQAYLGIGSFDKFLTTLGLKGQVTVAQYTEILAGRAYFSTELTEYLANLIPEEVAAPSDLRKSVSLIRSASRTEISPKKDLQEDQLTTARDNIKAVEAKQLEAKVKLRNKWLGFEPEKNPISRNDFLDIVATKLGEKNAGKGIKSGNREIVNQVAKCLGLHPWELEGYIPIIGRDIEKITNRLTILLYDASNEAVATHNEKIVKADDFRKLALGFFKGSTDFKLTEAQKAYPVRFGVAVDLGLQNKNISRDELAILVQQRGVSCSALDIENVCDGWLEEVDSKLAVAISEILFDEAKNRTAFVKTRKNNTRSETTRDDLAELSAFKEEWLDELNKLIEPEADGTVIYGADGEKLRLSQVETQTSGSKYFGERDLFRGYAVKTGGSGKTRDGMVMADAAAKAGGKTLVIVPSARAVTQTQEQYAKTAPHLSVGRIYEDAKEYGQDVTVMTYQSLLIELYKQVLTNINGTKTEFDISDFKLIVADEGHKYLTDLAQVVIEQTNAIIVALTATPFYHQDKQVEGTFGECFYDLPLELSEERKETAPHRTVLVEADIELKLNDIQLDSDGEYTRTAHRVFNTKKWNDIFPSLYATEIAEETEEPIFGDKSIVFCAGIKHAEDMAKNFNETLDPLLIDPGFRSILESKGIDPDGVEQIAAHVSGDDPNADETIQKFKDGKILVLTSDKLLAESIDIPAVRNVFHACLDFSFPRHAQKTMRGSRWLNGKEYWLNYEVLPRGAFQAKIPPVTFPEFVMRVNRDFDYSTTIKPKPSRQSGGGQGSKGNPNLAAARDLATDYSINYDTETVFDIASRLGTTRDGKRESCPEDFVTIKEIHKTVSELGYSIGDRTIREYLVGLIEANKNPLESTRHFTLITSTGAIFGYTGDRDERGTEHYFHLGSAVSHIVKNFYLDQKKEMREGSEGATKYGLIEMIKSDGYPIGQPTALKIAKELDALVALDSRKDGDEDTLDLGKGQEAKVAFLRAKTGQVVAYYEITPVKEYIIKHYGLKKRGKPAPKNHVTKTAARTSILALGYSDPSFKNVIADLEKALPEDLPSGKVHRVEIGDKVIRCSRGHVQRTSDPNGFHVHFADLKAFAESGGIKKKTKTRGTEPKQPAARKFPIAQNDGDFISINAACIELKREGYQLHVNTVKSKVMETFEGLNEWKEKDGEYKVRSGNGDLTTKNATARGKADEVLPTIKREQIKSHIIKRFKLKKKVERVPPPDGYGTQGHVRDAAPFAGTRTVAALFKDVENAKPTDTELGQKFTVTIDGISINAVLAHSRTGRQRELININVEDAATYLRENSSGRRPRRPATEQSQKKDTANTERV